MEKPSKEIFDIGLQRGGGTSSKLAFHVGDSLDTDVAGAVAGGWNPLRFREWFDEDWPDWFDIDTPETAKESQKKRQLLMSWGRRDTVSGLEWVEMWGLDDILTLFGFPEDDTKIVRTTYIRGMLDD